MSTCVCTQEELLKQQAAVEVSDSEIEDDELEPTVPATAASNEPTVPLASVSKDPAVLPASVSNKPSVPHASVSNELLVPPALVSNEPAVPTASVSNEASVPPASVSNEAPVLLASVSNEAPEPHASVSNEPPEPHASVSNEAPDDMPQGRESERSRNLKRFFRAHANIPAENSTIVKGWFQGLEISDSPTKSDDELASKMAGLSMQGCEEGEGASMGVAKLGVIHACGNLQKQAFC